MILVYTRYILCRVRAHAVAKMTVASSTPTTIHFLAQMSTVKTCRSGEFLFPQLCDRNPFEVWTKLGGDLLRNIVYVTDGGKYLSVEPGTTLDIGQIYENLIASAEKRELESTTMLKYDEKFQIFVALGLVLLIFEAFISERRKI